MYISHQNPTKCGSSYIKYITTKFECFIPSPYQLWVHAIILWFPLKPVHVYVNIRTIEIESGVHYISSSFLSTITTFHCNYHFQIQE